MTGEQSGTQDIWQAHNALELRVAALEDRLRRPGARRRRPLGGGQPAGLVHLCHVGDCGGACSASGGACAASGGACDACGGACAASGGACDQCGGACDECGGACDECGGACDECGGAGLRGGRAGAVRRFGGFGR